MSAVKIFLFRFMVNLLLRLRLNYFPKKTGKPGKPTLTSSSNRIVDGSSTTLTCVYTSCAVSKYQFFRNGHSVQAKGVNKSLTLNHASFSTAGSYTCKVSSDRHTSDSSSPVSLAGESQF